MTCNQSSNGKDGSNSGGGVTASSPATSTEEYKVGPRRPPKEYQFKPGQSGNPKGRKRKAPSLLPDFKRLFDQAVSAEDTTTQGEILTTADAGFKQLANQHAKGDRHARREAVAYAEKFDSDLMPGPHKASPEGVAEAARASSDYTLSDEVLERLSTSALNEIYKVVREVAAEKKNLKKMH